MIADVREMSMIREYRLFIVDTLASAIMHHRSLRCEKFGITTVHVTPLYCTLSEMRKPTSPSTLERVQSMLRHGKHW
jgi:hypothetical protein